MKPIVTLTISPTIDVSSHVDRVIPERKLRCGPSVAEPGGGGVNVARALRRFGADPLAIFTAGGHTGQRLLELVAQEDVRTEPLSIEGLTRENFTILESSSTLQYRFVMPGPSLSATEWAHILHVLETLDPAPEFLIASGSLPPGVPEDGYAVIAQIARKRGIKLVLDTSGSALLAALDAGIFLLKPNLAELAALEGEEWIEDGEHLRAATARILNEHACDAVVVSLGAGGALAMTSAETLRIPAPPVRPESKVGAGDSMVAGIVWGLMHGWTMQEAASFGVAAGAAAVMRPGSDLCRKDDTERLYAQMLAHQQPFAPIS